MSNDTKNAKASGSRPTLRRKTRIRDARPTRLVAFDLETTNIAKGTPRPLYLTAFSESESFSFACAVESLDHLAQVLSEHFLIPRFIDARFVAWNANNFDSYFIAAAIIRLAGFVVKPFLTRGKNLRGMMVMLADEIDLPNRSRAKWYFLDGIAMLGLAGASLANFLDVYAPEYRKLSGTIDFERETFDAKNATHRAYAMRDSEGLYYGIARAQEILIQYFNEPVAVTMGATCIKILTAHVPENVAVHSPPDDAIAVIRNYAMRGGYCFCVRSYHGRVWKYDINQAYAAAMRETRLPAGNCIHARGLNRYARVFFARVRAFNLHNTIPFYCKIADARGIPRAVFAVHEIADSWITSIEYEQLLNEGWDIEVIESFFFDADFTLREYVNKLEHVRTTCEGGPSGAIGTMIKAVGNHSYGKTVEQLDALDIVIARECPPGFAEYFPSEDDAFIFPHVWYRTTNESRERVYHQPQIGAFITAHVRMVVRRAALVAPEAWVYADTDCVVFDRDVTRLLQIDPKRYGAFKVEANGEMYRIIAKKVYSSVDGKIKHAKGLNVKRLTDDDFARWLDGVVPEQVQIQRQNFVKSMAGVDMYLERSRKGTRV